MKKATEFTEPEDRYCPICDAEIKKGSHFHKCTKKKLREIEKRSIDFNEEYLEKERTYDDKLKEYEDQYDNSTYYVQSRKVYSNSQK